MSDSDVMSDGDGSGDGSGDEMSGSMSASCSSLANSGAQWNEEDDENFGGGFGNKKIVSNDYELLSAAQVMERPLEMIQEVNELFQIDASVARQLLQHSNWNSEKLVTRYFAGEKDKLFAEAKIPAHLGTYKKPTGPTSCSVCFDEFDAGEIFGMPCNHFFCRECYADYLQVKINSEGRAAEIQCPAKDCFLLVDEVTAMKLLPPGPTKDRYLKLIAKAFVRDNKTMRGCPAPGCGSFAKMAVASRVVPIKCLCGEEYCSGCQQVSHRPCDCAMMQAWNNKIQSDSESENWLKLYTRNCPKCKATISKDGGCQYMRCQTCSTGFCWICMGLFDHKNHDCNKFELSADASEAAKSLAKWEHFSKRYSIQAQAINLQAKLRQAAETHIQKLENDHHKTYIELVFLLEAVTTVIAARKVLKDTYVYGYFLPDHVNRALFEFLQAELQQNTELLSSLVEAKKPLEVFDNRLKIVDLDKALRKSLQSILVALEKGDVKGGDGAAAPDAEWAKVTAPTYDGWVYNAN